MIWKGDDDMKCAERGSDYTKYRDDQIAWASAEDLLLILAQQLIRMKDETGINLFWDDSEEQFLRDYIEDAETAVQS